MRRSVFLTLGLLELVAAALLVAIAFQLPGGGQVERSFAQAQRVTGESAKQIAFLREELQKVHDPRVKDLLKKIEPQLPRIQARLKADDLNPDILIEANQSLGKLAEGMKVWGEALDPAVVRKLSEGVGKLASFLDEKVAPAAGSAAGRLEKSVGLLREDALKLSKLLKAAPHDLNAVRDIHDSLGRFGEGLDRVFLLVNPDRLKTMREGFAGMETSLDTGAEQIEKLAGYTYPSVMLQGFRPPKIEEKPFWPQGATIADGMRKGANALKAASKELDQVAETMPHLQKSMDESRKAVGKTRDLLGLALKNQTELEALMKSLPQSSARLAEDLPALAEDLTRVLRDVERLNEVAAALRQTQKGMEMAAKRLPEVRQNLLDSSARLSALQQKFDKLLGDPEEYRAALRQTAEVAESVAEVVPLLTAYLEVRVEEQQRSLKELNGNLDEIHAALPETGESTATLFRLLFWLLLALAAAALLHGGYLTGGSLLRPALIPTSDSSEPRP